MFEEGRADFQSPQKGADLEAELEVSLEEAYYGTESVVIVNGEKIKVKIPAGTLPEQKLRLAGKGVLGNYGDSPGDLYLKLKIKERKGLQLKGLDIHLDLPVLPSEAALGAKIKIPTLEGSVSLGIPANSNTGKVLRLKGLGMKDSKRNKGNLLVHLQIILPEKLSKEEKEIYSQLSSLKQDNVRKNLGDIFKHHKEGKHYAA